MTEAGLASVPPLSNSHSGRSFEAEGVPRKNPGERDPIILFCVVTPGYFETMGIELWVGRFFVPQDNRSDGEKTAIVNELFARHFWPGQDAIDKRIRFTGSQDWIRVVGVTGDVRHYGLEQPMRPEVYVPYGHASDVEMFGVVRTRSDPLSLIPVVRGVVRSADPGLPIHDVRTMSERMHLSMVLRFLYSWMFGVFGVVAAVMACAGIYGVVSYWVSQRTLEIGIRMAVGARTADVVAMVIGQGARLIGIGLCLGLAGAFVLTRLLAGTLYNVSPTDPLTFVGIPVLVAAAGALACYVPARRAAGIDPMSALRCE